MPTASGNTPAGLAHWLDRLERRHPTEIDLGLERCGEVYQRLGAPRPGRKVITVAGTNGKGSTVAWTDASLKTLGYRTGVYTSPHLLHFTERLQLLGKSVSPEALVAAFEAVEAARGEVSLTYFEFTTLACLLLMSRADLDMAILEVGLGGRLDTVNLVDADVAVITPIGLDHQAFLGNDRETIGREKAGILRVGQQCVCAEREPPESVLAQANALGCRVQRLGEDFELAAGPEGQWVFRLGEWRLALPGLVLSGPHQQDNLAAALTAVISLVGDSHPALQKLPAALREVRIKGRLQRIDAAPGYLLDVGHNPMAAEAVARALHDEAPMVAVLGMLADKDAEGVAEALSACVGTFVCAGLAAGQRAQDGATLAARVSSVADSAQVIAMNTVEQAMAQATALAGDHGPVLVFGSFHTVAEAMTWLADSGRIEQE